MGKVMIAYFSRTGKTEQMAEYIAEGIRITGHDVELRKISDLKSEKDLLGFEGLVIGCPTYHRTMPGLVETFLFMHRKPTLKARSEGLLGPIPTAGMLLR